MTDDLVKRLNEWIEWEVLGVTASDIIPIRDRIEALERERDELQKDFDGLDAASRTLINEARSIAEAAEARLAKAVEALREIEWSNDTKWQADCALAVLAEIEGGKTDE